MSSSSLTKSPGDLRANDDLDSVYRTMFGTDEVHLPIAYPRYKRMRTLCEKNLKVFVQVLRAPYLQHDDFESQRAALTAFIDAGNAALVEDITIDPRAASEDENIAFCRIYKALKDSDLVKNLIVVCDRLVRHKVHFADINKLNRRFVDNIAGAEWFPFPFTDLNFRQIFCRDDMTENTKDFFLTVFSVVYAATYAIFEETQEPDIDFDAFLVSFKESLATVEKQPALSRCSGAFNIIRNSMNMMRDNFGSYYRDSVAAGDTSIILQNFINDLMGQQQLSAKTIREFRVIISEFRKTRQKVSQSGNPRFMALFDKLNAAMTSVPLANLGVPVQPSDGKSTEVVDPIDEIEFAPEDSDELPTVGALSLEQLDAVKPRALEQLAAVKPRAAAIDDSLAAALSSASD